MIVRSPFRTPSRWWRTGGRVGVVVVLLALGGCQVHDGGASAAQTLLNVSYDPTRELYQAYDSLFVAHWRAIHGTVVTIRQSHGGSGPQARAVIEGLGADVVTLGLGYDVDAIAREGLIIPDWAGRLPHHSTPYTSTIVFLVRKGNPKHVRDWSDLTRPDVQVITSNPKTSSGARWAYLAAWGAALDRTQGNTDSAVRYITALYRRVPILDAGARQATTTFVDHNVGDVLLSWENEALLAVRATGDSQVEVVVPSVSILAEPPVSVVDKVAQSHGTTALATAYLSYLYSPEAQNLLARLFYRPSDSVVALRYKAQFASVRLFTVDSVFGGWEKAQATHFATDGTFDRIYQGQAPPDTWPPQTP